MSKTVKPTVNDGHSRPSRSASHSVERRTQELRTMDMRKRLEEATFECLRKRGYSGTTISTIIREAGVSRGTPLHHYPTKAALIAETAKRVMRRINRRLEEAIHKQGPAVENVHDLIGHVWQAVMGHPEQVVLNELLTASLHDEELASVLREVWNYGFDIIGAGALRYFQSNQSLCDARELMVLTQWLLRGMSQDRHLVNSPEVLEHYLKVWTTLLSTFLTPRPPTPE